MITHRLKSWPSYFEAILGGKRFDVRKNDRNYQKGDTIVLEEYDRPAGKYTGRIIAVKITYVMQATGGNAQGWKLTQGTVIMGIMPIDELITDQKFTAVKPTKEGFYWYRLKRPGKGNGDITYTDPAPCAVTMSYLSGHGHPEPEPQGLTVTLLGDYDIFMVKTNCNDFEWLGPINIPKGES